MASMARPRAPGICLMTRASQLTRRPNAIDAGPVPPGSPHDDRASSCLISSAVRVASRRLETVAREPRETGRHAGSGTGERICTAWPLGCGVTAYSWWSMSRSSIGAAKTRARIAAGGWTPSGQDLQLPTRSGCGRAPGRQSCAVARQLEAVHRAGQMGSCFLPRRRLGDQCGPLAPQCSSEQRLAPIRRRNPARAHGDCSLLVCGATVSQRSAVAACTIASIWESAAASSRTISRWFRSGLALALRCFEHRLQPTWWLRQQQAGRAVRPRWCARLGAPGFVRRPRVYGLRRRSRRRQTRTPPAPR